MLIDKSKKGKSVALRTALDGILAALALALAFLEGILPDVAFLPPGAKLGLANVAVMFAVLAVGYADGFAIMLIKSSFVFFTRGIASFIMSVSGGAVSCVVMIIIVAVSKKLNKEFSYIGISVICAVVHNIGQVAAASVYMSTNLMTSYLPLLIITGVASGFITGVVLRAVMPAILNKGLK